MARKACGAPYPARDVSLWPARSVFLSGRGLVLAWALIWCGDVRLRLRGVQIGPGLAWPLAWSKSHPKALYFILFFLNPNFIPIFTLINSNFKTSNS